MPKLYLVASKTRRAKRPFGTGALSWRALGSSPAALLKRCQKRFHACLHVRLHAWKLAGSSPGPVAGPNKLLRGF
eukprot:7334450-Pyramimonas_sp.AAC.1